MGKALFKKGQRCLVPHTDQYYAAHILKAQKREDGHHYLIHYDGWSKKYDEWVEESGLVKFDESLLPPDDPTGTGLGAGGGGGGASGSGQDAAAATGGTGGPAAGGAGGGGAVLSVRKRKADAAAGAEAQAPVDTTLPTQLRLHMPPLLKKVVLDDHDLVTHQYRLPPLPRQPNVREILRAFEAARAREAGAGGAADAATLEIVNGLLSYFDQGLRQLLLYQQEVQQYDQAVEGGKAPSDVYGGEHLVRLLVKLPELVPVATMGAQNVVTLEGRLHELMSLLVEKQGQFFLPSEAFIPNPHVQPPLPLPPLPAAATAAAPAPAAAVGGP